MAYKRKLSQMEIEETMQNFNIESDLEDSASEDESDENYGEEEDHANEQSVEESESSDVEDNLDFIGKDGYVWKQNSKRRGRIPQRNIIFQHSGPKNDGLLANFPERAFDLFINSTMISVISRWKNQKFHKLKKICN